MILNTYSMTYADILRPSKKTMALTYDTVLILVGSILIALSAKLSFLLPFSPVPVTGQTFAVLFIGALYGSKRGFLAVLAYLAEGIAGLPVFAGGTFGIMSMFCPSGGYLIGFVPAAFIAGWFSERGWDRKPYLTVISMVIASAAIYLFGLAGLSRFVGNKAFMLGFVPFIAGDILKIALATVLLPSGWKLVNKWNSLK